MQLESSEGFSPSLSHNGVILAFINNRQVWKAELSSEKNPESFFSTSESVGSLTWSPDGNGSAFRNISAFDFFERMLKHK